MRINRLPDSTEQDTHDGGLGALSTGKGNLPLDSVDVRAVITGPAVGIDVTQGFHNPFDVPLEATYIFPLPDRAAVTALRMETAGRVVEGILKEREQARRDYDTAIATGRRAAIAEEDRPDVFAMRVGNIQPGERVTIELRLNQPLARDTATESTFRFPLVVAPRYIPGTPLDDERAGPGASDDTDAVPDASRISPPVLLPGFPNPVRLSIAVDIDPVGLPLTDIDSALHVVSEETGNGRTTVRLRPGERLNRDFVLRLRYAERESAALALAPDDSGDEGTFTLTVLPSGEARPRPRDVVLVLDRSGSMQGWKIVAARRAAARIVDTLRAEDGFAVLSFDNVIEHPRGLDLALSAGTDRNRFRAVEHLASLEARGGTEMLAPLAKASALLDDPARDRVLVLITDGQVGNEDQIIAHLDPRLRGVRVHTIGIDRAVNAGFLNRLAAIGGGHCELVESEDRLDEAMEDLHNRIAAPIATGLSLESDLDIVPGTVTPSRLGALFPGVPLVISGRYRGSTSGALTVRGDTADGTTWSQRTTAVPTTDRAATALWARAHLRDLEDRYTVGEDLEKRIVDTSLRFGVLCRFTAFVAVDTRVTEAGTPHKVVQPVEPPSGWAHEDDLDLPDFLAGTAPVHAQAAVPMSFAAPPAPGAAPFGPGAAPPGPGAPPPAPAAPARARYAASSVRTPSSNDEITKALERLHAVPETHHDRLAHLRDHLLPALDSLVRRMETQSQKATPLAALRDALQKLTPTSSEEDVRTLWARTVQTLTDFVAPKRPFWKRGRR
ncbi:VIT domain-containing protein [Actinomadura algeriensis]|uniref:Ca-activated chloride channel family protein n=1 Tax=Actinomadura algeriensis TaxID=1679523 RepID=A0ABR9JQR9_9ACTN|nr:VIT domain-containing protein [Actinomadura algeriensis]MBE1532915.1 Ca-activated chloride channel family protein [Actinomadura algeriensis]